MPDWLCLVRPYPFGPLWCPFADPPEPDPPPPDRSSCQVTERYDKSVDWVYLDTGYCVNGQVNARVTDTDAHRVKIVVRDYTVAATPIAVFPFFAPGGVFDIDIGHTSTTRSSPGAGYRFSVAETDIWYEGGSAANPKSTSVSVRWREPVITFDFDDPNRAMFAVDFYVSRETDRWRPWSTCDDAPAPGPPRTTRQPAPTSQVVPA